jgi:redox-sensitive bicupin YhaK (pirin superfamily)
MTKVEMIIEPRKKDLGGFSVGRVLPYARRRHVGPFVFFDHMGPVELSPEQGMDVRPHPHIGLSTVTYLFEGSAVHRDSLGTIQVIKPGDCNWMTAGCGISHSERIPKEMKIPGTRIHGLQIWVALPKESEDVSPSFFHYPKHSLPSFEKDNIQVQVIVGELAGQRSPVHIYSPMFYYELKMKAGQKFSHLIPSTQEAAIYSVAGSYKITDQEISEHHMAVFEMGQPIQFEAIDDLHCVVIGGEPFPEERLMWWNLVSTSPEKIQNAKKAWAEQTFPMVPGETEFIPLPTT